MPFAERFIPSRRVGYHKRFGSGLITPSERGIWHMYRWTSSKGAVGFVLAACSIVACGDSGDTGATGSGGSANATGSGGNASGSGGGGNGPGTGFCLVGTKGCVCVDGKCASGLVCKNETCCDG